jgi:hypothetical protein
MTHKRLWLSAAIIALVLSMSFALSVPHTRDIGQAAVSEDGQRGAPTVTLRDTFKKGVHTITGSIEVPNVCTTVTAEAVATGDTPDTERILVVISAPKEEGVCLQLPASADFSVTISAPASLPITATVNGVEATTTVL